MKNQMMNLFASYSFYYFPGYYYCADCFCCKKQPSPTEGLQILRKRKRKCGAGVCDCSRHRSFLFPDTLKRMHETVPVFRLRYQPNTGISIFQSVFCRCVGIIFLKWNVRIILCQVSLCCCSGDDDHLVFTVPVVQALDNVAVRRYNSKCYVHVRKCEVYFFCTLVCDCEVCKDQINFSCLQILDTVCSFCRYKVDFYTEIFTDSVREVYIISLIFTVFINISKWILIGKYSDIDCSVFLISSNVR